MHLGLKRIGILILDLIALIIVKKVSEDQVEKPEPKDKCSYIQTDIELLYDVSEKESGICRDILRTSSMWVPRSIWIIIQCYQSKFSIDEEQGSCGDQNWVRSFGNEQDEWRFSRWKSIQKFIIIIRRASWNRSLSKTSRKTRTRTSNITTNIYLPSHQVL